jgi:hypothetical protein
VAIPREGREKEPAPAPTPTADLPTLTYDPGSPPAGTSRTEGLGTIYGASAGPAGFIGAAASTIVRAFTKGNRPWRGRTIVADADTGELRATGAIPQGRGVTALRDTEAASLEALQRTFDTGLVQAGIAPWYAEFADALARFRIELDLAEEQQRTPGHVPTPGVPGDRGESPPGYYPPPPEPTAPDSLGGPEDSTSIPVDLRYLFMTPNPFMPFSGLAPPRGGGGTRRRRRKKTAARRGARRSRARVARPARLVKGSAAAKRYMARLRRMRK